MVRLCSASFLVGFQLGQECRGYREKSEMLSVFGPQWRKDIKVLGCNGRKAAGSPLPDHHPSFFLSCLGVIGQTSV